MIEQVTINYFKAIEHCQNLQLQPFTVFIGNNGSGKSSVLEALRVLQIAVIEDLQEAFKNFKGLDRVRNYLATISSPAKSKSAFNKANHPIDFIFSCKIENKHFDYRIAINLNETGDYYIVESEELVCNGKTLILGEVVNNEGLNFAKKFASTSSSKKFSYQGDRLLLNLKIGSPYSPNLDIKIFYDYISNWQFLYLNAHIMGEPYLQNRLNRKIKLNYDGNNIAEYLIWLKDTEPNSFDNIIRKMTFVLPYLQDIKPRITEVINREIDLLLSENNENSKPLPGWLLSSGTLRILALLAMFDTPAPPSLLFIDEVENGLDPRTIGLLLSEVEQVYNNKSMQVIVTTHSPYFLDQVPLESIIVAEKDLKGSEYHIPGNEENLKIWKEKFSPGKLYTMGKLIK